MKAQALLIALLTGACFTANAADQTTPAAGPGTRQAPIALSAAQMDQVVAGGAGRGTGVCTGTGIPKRDGTGPKYGKK